MTANNSIDSECTLLIGDQFSERPYVYSINVATSRIGSSYIHMLCVAGCGEAPAFPEWHPVFAKCIRRHLWVEI